MEPDGVAVAPTRRELVNGAELAVWDTGSGPALICIHETAAAAEIWEGVEEAAAGSHRVLRYDRRGWGLSESPPDYRRTTVSEQAEDAATLLERLGVGRAIICGAGLGAVAALDLALRRPGICAVAVLIEPPLLAFLPQATEGLSADRAAVEEAVREGGASAAFDLYAGGALPFLGAGAGRLPARPLAAARERPESLFAEVAAVPAWEIRTEAMLACSVPTVIVTGASTPPVLRMASEELAARLGEPHVLRVGGEGAPHVSAAPELAQRIARLA